MDFEKAEVGKLRRTPLTPDIRTLNEDDRTIEFVASTEAVDRYGDVIRVKGWKLDAYRKNPVFLFAHRSKELPIGRAVDVRIEANPPALIQRIQFATKDEYEFADTVFKLYKGGFMRAVSVGFLPLEPPELRTDEKTGEPLGYEFNGQELLELSAVPVPANAEALARAIGDGVIDEREAALVGERAEKSDRQFRDEIIARVEMLESQFAELRQAVKPAEKSEDPLAELRERQRQAERAGDKALVELLGIEIATQTGKPKHEEAPHKSANAIDEVLMRIMGAKQ